MRILNVIIVITCSTFAISGRAETVTERQWRAFQANPALFMEMPPPRYDSRGQVVSSRLRFPAPLVKNGSYIDVKRSFRRATSGKCRRGSLCLREPVMHRIEAGPNGGEDIGNLIDPRELKATNGRILKRIDEIDSQRLRAAQLDEMPWSDHYWPIARGILGNRYASREFQYGGSTWKGYYDFINADQNSLLTIYLRGDTAEIDLLSPSEKYDLLIGQLSGARSTYQHGYLTPFMWEEGERYWNATGNVEGWMGICHGWAAAAFMLKRPSHVLNAVAADGKTVLRFYPSDMKGLASYIWANAQPSVRFIGGRCDQKNPARDPETGRILDSACFDTNPGIWHMAVVNQIGIAKRSFVMDATYDYEVWNQPVFSYHYTYFNPETGTETATLKEAIVSREQFASDKFRKFRSPKAKYVVGISMNLAYMVETQPSHAEVDSAENDYSIHALYMYDLELDAKLNIIGGEWYSNKHPDFLWLPDLDARATSQGDGHLNGNENWMATQPLPRFWADIAVATATRYGEPLATIIDRMIATSNNGAPPRP